VTLEVVRDAILYRQQTIVMRRMLNARDGVIRQMHELIKHLVSQQQAANS
jgi:hypothetical protein